MANQHIRRELARMDSVAIDDRIAVLVDTLNRVPGITTISSCGGHRRRTNPSQVRENEFYVDLAIDQSRKGWKALGILVEACDDFGGDVTITPWLDGGLRWDLRGRNVSPARLASALGRLAAEK